MIHANTICAQPIENHCFNKLVCFNQFIITTTNLLLNTFLKYFVSYFVNYINFIFLSLFIYFGLLMQNVEKNKL